jgi:hypothetical protein
MQYSPKGTRRTRQVSELLKPGKSTLGKLLAVARELDRLDRKLATLLDPSMVSSVQVAALRDHCLLLATPSAALATRLRLDSGHLVKALHAAGEKNIREIAIRVAPVSRNKPVERHARELSETAKRSLERFAEDSGDAEIAAIVNRKHTGARNE